MTAAESKSMGVNTHIKFKTDDNKNYRTGIDKLLKRLDPTEFGKFQEKVKQKNSATMTLAENDSCDTQLQCKGPRIEKSGETLVYQKGKAKALLKAREKFDLIGKDAVKFGFGKAGKVGNKSFRTYLEALQQVTQKADREAMKPIAAAFGVMCRAAFENPQERFAKSMVTKFCYKLVFILCGDILDHIDIEDEISVLMSLKSKAVTASPDEAARAAALAVMKLVHQDLRVSDKVKKWNAEWRSKTRNCSAHAKVFFTRRVSSLLCSDQLQKDEYKSKGFKKDGCPSKANIKKAIELFNSGDWKEEVEKFFKNDGGETHKFKDGTHLIAYTETELEQSKARSEAITKAAEFYLSMLDRIDHYDASLCAAKAHLMNVWCEANVVAVKDCSICLDGMDHQAFIGTHFSFDWKEPDYFQVSAPAKRRRKVIKRKRDGESRQTAKPAKKISRTWRCRGDNVIDLVTDSEGEEEEEKEEEEEGDGEGEEEEEEGDSDVSTDSKAFKIFHSRVWERYHKKYPNKKKKSMAKMRKKAVRKWRRETRKKKIEWGAGDDG